MAGNGQQFQASADINVSVFVVISGDNQVATAGAGAGAIGVMHESSWDTPIPGANDTIAVPTGQSKRVYQATARRKRSRRCLHCWRRIFCCLHAGSRSRRTRKGSYFCRRDGVKESIFVSPGAGLVNNI